MTELDRIIAKNFGLSRSESRRLIENNGVRDAEGNPVKDEAEINDGDVLQVGRNRRKAINKEDN